MINTSCFLSVIFALEKKKKSKNYPKWGNADTKSRRSPGCICWMNSFIPFLLKLGKFS